MKKKLSMKLFLCISIVCLVFSCSFIAISYAKYTSDSEKTVVQKAENFYFVSRNNLLNGQNTTINVNNSNIFTVEIMNYNDILHITPSDITFTFSVNGGTFTGGAAVGGVYTLTGGEQSSIIFTITASSNAVEVTASATNPYTKTISREFNIVTSDSSYSYSAVTALDNSLALAIHTGASLPTITVVWDMNYFAHDNTNLLLANATYTGTTGEAVLTNMQPNSNYTINFVKVVNGTSSAMANTVIAGSVTINLPTLI